LRFDVVYLILCNNKNIIKVYMYRKVSHSMQFLENDA